MSREGDFKEEKRRRRQEYLRQQELKAWERENQPRDDEERRNAEAEDKHLEENLAAILRQTRGMSEQDFGRWVKKNSRKVRKAGGAGKVKRAHKKAGGCVVIAILLVAAALGALGAGIWGAYEAVAAVIGQ